ncbi:hypothetical protein [Caloramator sp. Dgby_cultured_2]|nr:hypothetical protein [Caloramator sp. Dgby_cultured_2]WDU82038.1 hypothetical protein PWK10_09480 [Caloramator sp. Dgby_cultured_2]
MKRIWIMNHYAVPPTIGGGTRHFDFAEELVKGDMTLQLLPPALI